MNQYTTTPLDQRTYDLNGNLTGILGNDVAGNALTLSVSCLYDYRNRMVEYKDELTGQRHTYAYDALGRRIAKTVDADGVSYNRKSLMAS
jgi:YD repeat-containing protein